MNDYEVIRSRDLVAKKPRLTAHAHDVPRDLDFWVWYDDVEHSRSIQLVIILVTTTF